MLVKWNPYTDLDRSLNDVFTRGWFGRPLWDDQREEVETWKPPVNIYEDKESLLVEAQVPGIDMKDVTLSVDDHTLELKGERKVEHEEQKDGYHFKEARYGSFARSFTLPSYVSPEKATAKYDRGVLTITIPKREEAKPRVIPIDAK